MGRLRSLYVVWSNGKVGQEQTVRFLFEHLPPLRSLLHEMSTDYNFLNSGIAPLLDDGGTFEEWPAELLLVDAKWPANRPLVGCVVWIVDISPINMVK